MDLAQRIEKGDLDAKRHLIEADLRLVVHNAKRYRRDPRAAAPAASHGMGRELAWESPCASRFGVLQPSLVAGGHRLVRDSRVGNAWARDERSDLSGLRTYRGLPDTEIRVISHPSIDVPG